uniref:Uncharacterized protein n=1 Tax=Cacopsylla melanoneura TaxID=428564 RepID=A0A8D8Y8A9_9HEMI
MEHPVYKYTDTCVCVICINGPFFFEYACYVIELIFFFFSSRLEQFKLFLSKNDIMLFHNYAKAEILFEKHHSERKKKGKNLTESKIKLSKFGFNFMVHNKEK